jgi:hypothetical protein
MPGFLLGRWVCHAQRVARRRAARIVRMHGFGLYLRTVYTKPVHRSSQRNGPKSPGGACSGKKGAASLLGGRLLTVRDWRPECIEACAPTEREATNAGFAPALAVDVALRPSGVLVRSYPAPVSALKIRLPPARSGVLLWCQKRRKLPICRENKARTNVQDELWYSLDRGSWRITRTVVDGRREVGRVQTSTVAGLLERCR